MSEKMKKGWSRIAFGDVVRQVHDRVDPEESGLERYVAGEHMNTDDLKIRKWGTVGDGYLGPAFIMRFKPGQVLYGSRRTYLRKVAVADFEGITANTTFVLESKDPKVLLPELLPFIMQTEAFHEHSIKQSKGSVNPYINFSDLTWYEFALPPLDEQRRIAELLNITETAYASFQQACEALDHARVRFSLDVLSGAHFLTSGVETRALGDIAIIVMGQSPEGTTYNLTGIGTPLLNGPTEFGEIHPTAKQYTTLATKCCEKGDILFCVRGSTTGRRNLADTRYCIGRGLAAIRAKEKLSISSFLAVLLEGLEFIVFREAKGAGSTFPNIDSARLHAQLVKFPNLDEQLIIGGRHLAMSVSLANLKKRREQMLDLKREILRMCQAGTSK